MRSYMYVDHVTIEDDVWIGESVTICPGVTIGKNSVIGAGSVAVKHMHLLKNWISYVPDLLITSTG